MGKSAPSQSVPVQNVNAWAFLQNVIIRSIDKGQLVALLLGLILFVFAVRMPSDQIVPTFHKTLELLKSGAGVSYCANGGLIGMWAISSRRHRDQIAKLVKASDPQ